MTVDDERLSVLFVCVENACRSQMAEAFARRHGNGRVHAESCGSQPSGVVNARTVASMAERGYDLSAYRSKGPAELPSTHYDVLVTLGCGDRCPAISAARHEDWAIPDPKDLPPPAFARIRDEIKSRVNKLIANL